MPVKTKSSELIQRFARSEELSIGDMSLDIGEEILDIDDANLEVFFLTPIILYIIKEIISKTLYDEKNK